MDEPDHIITAAELDAMTPDERAASFAASIVTDWADVPREFRGQVIATAERLASERRMPTAE